MTNLIEDLTTRTVNGLHHVSGRSLGETASTPRSTVWRRDTAVLHRYDSVAPIRGPVLLVMSLATRPTIFDLAPGSSLVADLLGAGHDVFLLDWGVPTAVDAWNTLETYCDDLLPAAVAEVSRLSDGEPVGVVAYCLGALLALLAAAGNPSMPVASIVCIATPVDFRELGPMALLFEQGRLEADDVIDVTGNVPAKAMLEGFRMTHPTNFVARYANLWQSLTHRKALASYQAVIGWSSSHIPFPGGVMRQIVELFLRRRLLLEGWVPLGGRRVALADVPCPVLSVLGSRDNLVPPSCSAPLPSVLAGARLETLTFDAGHGGLLLGGQARRVYVPAMIDWLAAA